MASAVRVRVLLTGFEPFGGARVNPSWEVARQLAERGVGDGEVEVVAELLPVSFGRVRAALAGALERYRPDVVVSLGLAAGRAHVSVERVGLNLAVARIPDNDGAQPRDAALAPGRPDAYFATLPVAQVLAADSRVLDSLSAGAFVCNAALYHLLDLSALGVPGSERVHAAGFLHVPATGPDSLASHDEVGHTVPIVPVDEVADAVAGAVRAAARRPQRP